MRSAKSNIMSISCAVSNHFFCVYVVAFALPGVEVVVLAYKSSFVLPT